MFVHHVFWLKNMFCANLKKISRVGIALDLSLYKKLQQHTYRTTF